MEAIMRQLHGQTEGPLECQETDVPSERPVEENVVESSRPRTNVRLRTRSESSARSNDDSDMELLEDESSEIKIDNKAVAELCQLLLEKYRKFCDQSALIYKTPILKVWMDTHDCQDVRGI
ncbi:hypothetical protein NPIL_43841 [Nephila pilipes]|uniref:Uncharacterized protein n=1 Tax=Nephila pilipes TaxID=299642 RepID=A0A8X6QVQ5_NEPPI|nr:hypothetical protein NPIL_43841 [Nephila pilipes]